MGEKLTDSQRLFLELLGDAPKPRSDLPLADRQQDKARQQCRRLGFAKFIGGRINGQNYRMGWAITPAGRAALSPPTNPNGQQERVR